MSRQTTPAMLLRNKLGTLVLRNAPQKEIDAARQALALATLEPHIQAALETGVTAGRIRRIAEKLAGAK